MILGSPAVHGWESKLPPTKGGLPSFSAALANRLAAKAKTKPGKPGFLALFASFPSRERLG